MNLDSKEYSVEKHWKYIYVVILFFSLCSASVIPIIYLYSPKCRHHPAQILLILCRIFYILGILEMITCYQWFLDSVHFEELIEFLNKLIGYNKMREYYLFGQGEISDETLCSINQSLIFFGFLAQLNYYAILTLDFILTLTKPFWNTKMKLLSYNLGACLVTITMFSFVTHSLEGNCHGINTSKVSEVLKVQLLVITTLLVISFYVGKKDLNRMNKINIDVKENRKKLFYNHLVHQYIYLIQYLFFTLFILWSLPQLIALLSEYGAAQKILNRIYIAIMLLHRSNHFVIDSTQRTLLQEQMCTFTCNNLLQKEVERKQGVKYIGQYYSKNVDDSIMEQCQLPLNKLVQVQTNQETVSNILSSILKVVSYEEKITDLHQQCKYKKQFRFSPDKMDQFQINQESPLLNSINYSFELTLTFQIQEYAPAVFQDIRLKNGISYEQFQKSLRLDYNQDQIKNTQESLGKSGSFFFYTYDNAFVLKTIKQSEIKLIQEFLEDYYKYIINNQTFLAKFYGMFSISIEGFSQIHLLLMENIFQQIPDQRVVYDLKGSLVNRKQSVKGSQVVDLTILKDQNFIKSTDIFIQLNQQNRDALFTILKEDIEFLLKNNIMDYSLLIAVCNSKIQDENRIYCNSNRCYCFGLIDYTQRFTLSKKLESFYKFYLKRKGQNISCVDPQFYSQRFISFINSIIAINDFA
ncbi:unnamed protein product (macronuclear) [Paramecium tetraurelia]|uniref:PIPK domain-containing protein n=1 Tax=Paramecium tetraurelia TaxID=5888 RepID=A0D8Z3_PARTE|nr:uncharacterized protein GSPATT00014456001 [Paramecium tetraurelia]CAK79510.1 unnamed protein product [Paramecium tetraurelia]|eukprot:XP_001446907.1 hypothetical protein (macronuclear) [Paramecium tetraurelia strain d4-2]